MLLINNFLVVDKIFVKRVTIILYVLLYHVYNTDIICGACLLDLLQTMIDL